MVETPNNKVYCALQFFYL